MSEHDPNDQLEPEQPAAICGEAQLGDLIGGEDRPLPGSEPPISNPSAEEN